MRHIFRLAEQTEGLMTRGQGAKIRERLETLFNKLQVGDQIAIDFSDVHVMTPSFADECLGKLAESLGVAEFRDKVVLEGANEIVRTLVNSILSARLSCSKA